MGGLIMKKLLALIALSVLVACSPTATTPVTGGFRVVVPASWNWKGFVVASSSPIADGWLSDAPCYRQVTLAGPNNALRCVAPNDLTIKTSGQTDVRELKEVPTP